jgi:neutral ceramidase
VRRGVLAIVVAIGPTAFGGVCPVATPTAGAATLRAGAGQADITPPQTGYYLGGWTRADRLAEGQSSRLFANTLVLQRGSRKVALVAAELFAIPAAMHEDVARRVASLGFDRTSILLQASHTHSGPGGFFPNPTYNTAAPSTSTVSDPLSFVRLLNPDPADVQLYTFLVDRIAESIRRADADRAPAAAAWGHTTLLGVTQNRSIEAHLADHGIKLPTGQGSPQMDPDGPDHTIDPDVDVLRVDKLRRGRHIPIGAWSNFADHGTVVHAELQAYSGDHHAAAWRVFSKLVRRHGHVPARQTVVNVYPNADEGDQTAGIAHVGPAAADWVGTQEALAMVRAWRAAGPHLSRTPALDERWTRTCFCGRDTATGKVDTQGREGMGFLTGSEEGRGPLYDVTGVSFEGMTNPFEDPVQGDKYVIPGAGNPPPAVPIAVVRVGDHVLAALPGEPTKEVGARVKRALLDKMAPAGVRGVVIAGLADDYVQYITTPEEYGQQSYEGASTLYGKNEATFLQEQLADLGARLAAGQPAPEPYALDPSYGVKPDGPAYPAGADHGTAAHQPLDRVERLGHASFGWNGAPSAHDLPTDRAFVSAQRRDRRGRWHTVDTDLGLDFLWRADDQGRYDATWEVPITVPAGTYRLRVTAARYALSSRTFRVMPSRALIPVVRDGAVRLTYPEPVVNVDLTARPAAANGGRVSYVLGGVRHTIRHPRGAAFAVPTGATIPVGGARDRYGNTNGAPAQA